MAKYEKSKQPKWAAREQEFRNRAKELVAKMTLEEKVSQTLHQSNEIERLNIPYYNWWNESIHGVGRAGTATVFPQAIGLAAMFDEDTMEKVGETISTEARAKFNVQDKFGDHDIYKGLTFWSPNVNIFRDPRWGRGQETYGEDPYLTSRMGVRFIEGMQGDGEFMKAAACVKHFAVHSGPEAGRHEFNSVVNLRDLYETYLPAFRAGATEAHVAGAMGAYNRTNGEPCCGSKTLLKDLLRDDWGFTGYVTSDCWAIRDFHLNHKVTENEMESVSMAMNNGCDVNCGNLFGNLYMAVQRGLVEEERIDEALENLFTIRMQLGLFEDEMPYSEISYLENDSDEHRAFNFEVSKKCQVLLKNDGILPLKKGAYQTIGVIGPNANSRAALFGNYEGTSSRYITVLEGIQDYVGDSARVLYSEGCHLYKSRISGLTRFDDDRKSEVQAVIDASDVLVVCLGLDGTIEGEEGDSGNEFASGDKINLAYPGLQPELLELACESGKPVILLSLCGSTMDMRYADEHANAVIQCWYPGAQGGKAVAALLFGEANFEGKLPMTVYEKTEDLPDFKDYAMKNRTYRYMTAAPRYPFGYGLSYTKFELTDAKLSADSISKDGKITVTATVKNTGKFDGNETVQVYITAPGEEAPKYQLKGLKRVALKAGEEKTVELELSDEAFALFDNDAKLCLNQGEATAYVGLHQPDAVSEKLSGNVCKAFKVTIPETAVLYEGKGKF